MLIEPAESESKATLDDFVESWKKKVKEIETDSEIVKTAHRNQMTVIRLDEV